MAFDDYDYPRVAVLVLLVAVNLALVGAMTTSSAAYGPYNGEWDGADTLRTSASESAEVDLATTTDRYGELSAGESLAVVLAPSEPTDGEAAQVQSFVSRGGTLVVAGESPNATDPYLDAVGSSVRVNGTQLRDDQNNYRGPQLPVANNVSDHNLTEGVESVTLNDGTALEPSDAPSFNESDVTPLINSSTVAYLDSNGNETYDTGEPFGSLPVATVEPEGEGHIVAVSDPSAFTNAMLDREGNQAFLAALLDGREHVLLDYSQHSSLPPLVYALITVRTNAPLQLLVSVLAFGAFGTYVNRGRLFAAAESALGRDGDEFDIDDITLDEAAVKALIEDRHPDWDEEYADRVTEAIIRQREGPRNDD
ncbi:DUF4350 domain-containing protein [Halosimplex rubrum]|uniref:DUF4350 domain-containing protein n=1 Tax=Halosimplex rubrum TaxID=869889 RepID=A0A7D5NZG4_9EURY|nr:DUF4350 domain-containing protein [Halosimplex rubrum]QLH76857.1 DUF4350 domain-containing protein [Halosimplex rubrum]